MKLKSLLLPALAAIFLVGCEANGVDAGLGGGGGGGGGGDLSPPPGSIADTTNCAAAVSGLCVLGGESHPGGIVDLLLAPEGPLGPIAGAINVDALVNTLTVLLTNDDGTLAGLVRGLTADGQVLEALLLLLVGEDGQGQGAIAETLVNLLLPNEEGTGLLALIGGLDGGGVVGFLQALLLGGEGNPECQAPLGTLCLIAGEGDQQGLIDILLTSGGLAGSLSQTLTQEVLDDLVATLGDLLASDGSLTGLVQGLFAEGHLIEGLSVLLRGTDGEGGLSLLEIIEGTLSNLGGIVTDVLGFVRGLLTPFAPAEAP
tara:strand:+ start:981 stop:1925 length:945 start_codon:yes stop_codon:yes gene_type:complete